MNYFYGNKDFFVKKKDILVCGNCSHPDKHKNLFKVKYWNIIQNHQMKQVDKKNSQNENNHEYNLQEDNEPDEEANMIEINKNYNTPEIFRNLYPKMDYNEYQNLQNDENFRQKEALVCMDCYLFFISDSKNNPDYAEVIKKQEMINVPKYIPQKKPEQLRQRFDITRNFIQRQNKKINSSQERQMNINKNQFHNDLQICSLNKKNYLHYYDLDDN